MTGFKFKNLGKLVNAYKKRLCLIANDHFAQLLVSNAFFIAYKPL